MESAAKKRKTAANSNAAAVIDLTRDDDAAPSPLVPRAESGACDEYGPYYVYKVPIDFDRLEESTILNAEEPKLQYRGRTFFVNTTLYDSREEPPVKRITFAKLLERPGHSGVRTKREVTALITGMQFSASGWEVELLRSCPVYVVMQDPGRKSSEKVREVRMADAPSCWRIWCWKPPGYGCMHAKLMLLKFPGVLRVVVTSANPFPYWALVRDLVWVQDFPLKKHAAESPFEASLKRALNAIRVPQTVQQVFDVAQYDFSDAQADLILSVPGQHTASACDVGSVQLAHAMQRMNPPLEPSSTTLHCASSSYGWSMTKRWLREMAASMLGCKGNSVPMDKKSDFPANMRLYYPTASSARAMQRSAQDVYCMRAGAWNTTDRRYPYPKDLFYDYLPNNGRIRGAPCMHAKFLFMRCSKTGAGALYLGSHNFSKTAWGSLNGKNLVVGSVELGVLLNTQDAEELSTWESWLPVNLEFAPKYFHEAGDLPFFSNDH